MRSNPPNFEKWFRNRANGDLRGLLRLAQEYLSKCALEEADGPHNYDNQRQIKELADKLRRPPWRLPREDIDCLFDCLHPFLDYLEDQAPTRTESETCHS